MAQWFVIYTKDGCRMCLKTLELLQVMGADYYEEVLPNNDDWPVPQVFLEENHVGGYIELQEYLNRGTKHGSKKAKGKYRSA